MDLLSLSHIHEQVLSKIIFPILEKDQFRNNLYPSYISILMEQEVNILESIF